jgi:hypothetical protein
MKTKQETLMAINFPTNPILGDTYSSNNILFRYDGTRWLVETAVSDVIQFVRTGTLEQRPVVTQPTLYYNTTTQALEFYDVEFSQWNPISMLSPLVNPTTVTGQITYSSPGTYSWVCPSEVYYVNAICVGGGASGAITFRSSTAFAGGGGGLAWRNNIPVIPGNSYTVRVGAGGGGRGLAYTAYSGVAGGDSWFIDETTVLGGGGGVNQGGTFLTDPNTGGGGFGGQGLASAASIPGGGGAGGYSGNGGASAAAGTGGGGGGGFYDPNISLSNRRAGAGGGVGILGEGASGGASQGGSGGTSGGSSIAGIYGGGAGAATYDTSGGGSMISGGGGAVRLIWGPNRAFPSTNTGDL